MDNINKQKLLTKHSIKKIRSLIKKNKQIGGFTKTLKKLQKKLKNKEKKLRNIDNSIIENNRIVKSFMVYNGVVQIQI